ncbi:Flp pilus assembly protein CpaB [Bradyrhizobium sp. U87765 SZCCT0131]|uniref:Flp pilus assembly protein CpaB n=1 Tax=unclassified Bradyrhizobium TaxID=2631580 RepID=UPI001BAAD4E0|nr:MULTISPECIES: Flp pilus assembly protein CpaB [unclassified Bradyrhizobium]MBR1222105.1 Flp pilus assembly protein CpaB [Bradyrhizobium sp. U87765 SZCCT0131]MBR1263697.1 Flp pilus assembly protein CpaB [Bradyrhizobium sp. U87765 SZCCT0134]MBR1302733.1 Flp pilus assembly protein CpaB [Bradyrhizobium sp. U87765 SZCCT0110]MBR1319947.1 Flp pilus assembly protein CpaB [Bradyrhizobium sp. U87765 SZCCT0109]MBR1348940.1 Flp pilus assembly protein CpaB [Bradyrhizobium sp. U87765 SZCCT0048]
MNTARIVVLALSVAAGGLAIYLVSGQEPKQIVQAPPVQQIETVDVLVAKSDIPMGQTVTPNDLQWQTWPAANASTNFIRRNDKPDAITQLVGSIARSPFISGEPIRELKLVKGPGSGIMAAILPSGMRAISTEISAETGAGGFILPNDRVDVILSRREKTSEHNGSDSVVSEIILGNVRVLAIDQTIEEKNGQKVVVGKTATLELKPEQAETLAKARQTGTLALALRSIVDANAPPTQADRIRGSSISVVRFGVPTSTTVQR